MSLLSERLRELRGRLTQKEIAAELGCSGALVSAWESSRALPPLLRLQQYASRFGDGDRHALLTELLELHENERRLLAVVDNGLGEVLEDIRWLLVEIRDRLPPR